jgi:hypothetical protein
VLESQANPTILQRFVNVSIYRGHPYPAPAPDEVKEIKIPESAVRTEESGPRWTLIRSRPVERKTMDPANADAPGAAFQSFNAQSATVVAVL